MGLLNLFQKKNNQEESDQEYCPLCDSKMVIREGKFGKFWSCTQFPGCKGTLSYQESLSEEEQQNFFDYQLVSVKNLSVVTGMMKCEYCSSKIQVSGFGISEENSKFLDEGDLEFYGYDIYIARWSEILHQLPEPLRMPLIKKYHLRYKPNSKRNYYFSNVCSICNHLMKESDVYDELSGSSPFGVHSKERLRIEEIALEVPLLIQIKINGQIAPKTQFLKRVISFTSRKNV